MHLKKKLVDSVNCCPVLCVCFFLVCVSHLCVISYVCGNGWAGWSSSCTLDTHTPPAETLTSPTLQFTHTQTEKEKWKLIGKTCRWTYTEQKERLWDGGREREEASLVCFMCHYGRLPSGLGWGAVTPHHESISDSLTWTQAHVTA